MKYASYFPGSFQAQKQRKTGTAQKKKTEEEKQETKAKERKQNPATSHGTDRKSLGEPEQGSTKKE